MRVLEGRCCHLTAAAVFCSHSRDPVQATRRSGDRLVPSQAQQGRGIPAFQAAGDIGCRYSTMIIHHLLWRGQR